MQKIFSKSLALSLIAFSFATSALAAPVRQFSVQGVFNYLPLEGNGDTTIKNLIGDALNGKSFSLVFGLDFGAADIEPSANVGEFSNAVSGTSATSGAYVFAPLATPCVNVEIDCRVSIKNDQFNIGFDSYLLSTGFVSAAQLNADVGRTVSLSFFLSAGAFGLMSNDSMLDPSSLLLDGASGAFFLTDSGLGAARFDLVITRITEVIDQNSVPLPGSAALMGLSLAALAFVQRRTTRKRS